MTVTAIVTLAADVMPHLNMTQVPADGGLELQGFIASATVVIEDIVGHVVPATFDEFYDGGNTTIRLRELPLLTVASINEVIGLTTYSLTNQPVGQPVDNFAYTIDSLRLGVITRRSASSTPYPFFGNTSNIEVVYTAGRLTVPANIRLATLELIREWFQNGQQGYGKQTSYAPAEASDSDDAWSTTPAGYMVPNRVKQLCGQAERPIVFA